MWLGKDVSGKPIAADLARMPHLLVAGTTGAGKSGCVNAMLTSILLRATPDEVRLVLVDPKQVELNHYEAIPHLLTPVITSPRMAANALQNLVREMEWRYGIMSMKRTRSLVELNKVREAEDDAPLPYILCVIDELADLMMVAPADVEDSIIRLAQKARAVGIHLVLATQSPRVDVITGMIKANVPSRIAFAVSSQTDSRVILDQNGAESLLGQGDMLFAPVGSSRLQRIQGAYIDEPQIAALTTFWARQGEPELREDLLEEVEPLDSGTDSDGGSVGEDGFDPDEDPLLGDAIQLVVEMGTASTSMLQRRLRLGYTRAGRLIDMLERRGIISGYEGSKPRQVLVTEGDLPRVLASLDPRRRRAEPVAEALPAAPTTGPETAHPPELSGARRYPSRRGCQRSGPHFARRVRDSASTSPRSRSRRRSARSTCVRWRTRSGTCSRGRPTSRASCAPTPRRWGSTGACWSRSTSCATSASPTSSCSRSPRARQPRPQPPLVGRRAALADREHHPRRPDRRALLPGQPGGRAPQRGPAQRPARADDRRGPAGHPRAGRPPARRTTPTTSRAGPGARAPCACRSCRWARSSCA